MQILIGKIRHFDYLSHISVNLSHTQKYKVCSINLCKVFHDVLCFFMFISILLCSLLFLRVLTRWVFVAIAKANRLWPMEYKYYIIFPTILDTISFSIG